MKDDIYQLTYEFEQQFWWYVARRRIVIAQLEDILKSIKNNINRHPRLLDYGCGTGLNLIHFASLGDAYGCDTSEIAIDFCRKRGVQNVRQIDPQGCYEEKNLFGHLFDVVTMLDVLEHIPEDKLALRRISKLLKPRGILLVTVPAFEFLWSGEDYVSKHQRRYTKSSLKRTFRQAGYEIIKITYFNFFLFPAQVATGLYKRLFYPRSMYETNVVPLSPNWNSLLTSIMSFEVQLLRRCSLPVGGSILCCGTPLHLHDT